MLSSSALLLFDEKFCLPLDKSVNKFLNVQDHSLTPEPRLPKVLEITFSDNFRLFFVKGVA